MERRTLTLATAVMLFGLAAIIVGVVNGFMPVGRCGSAFNGDGVSACRELTSESARWTVQLIVGGFVLLLGSALMSGDTRKPEGSGAAGPSDA